jgi:O-antigen ligase
MYTRSSQGIVELFHNRRLPYIKIGTAMWASRPWLGVGPGQYRVALKEFKSRIEGMKGTTPYYSAFRRAIRIHVHSLPLQLAVEFGLLGLAGFVYMFVRVWMCCMRSFSKHAYCRAGIGLVLAFSIHNLFDVTFPSLGLEMGILLGASVGAGSGILTDASTPGLSPK